MTQKPAEKREFASFAEFYPFYVSQHHLKVTRAIHATGSLIGLGIAAKALLRGPRKQVIAFPIISYSCAWFSHFVIEKNVPATFGYPKYSLMGDWTMIAKMITGKDAETQALADQWLLEHPEDRPGSYVLPAGAPAFAAEPASQPTAVKAPSVPEPPSSPEPPTSPEPPSAPPTSETAPARVPGSALGAPPPSGAPILLPPPASAVSAPPPSGSPVELPPPAPAPVSAYAPAADSAFATIAPPASSMESPLAPTDAIPAQARDSPSVWRPDVATPQPVPATIGSFATVGSSSPTTAAGPTHDNWAPTASPWDVPAAPGTSPGSSRWEQPPANADQSGSPASVNPIATQMALPLQRLAPPSSRPYDLPPPPSSTGPISPSSPWAPN